MHRIKTEDYGIAQERSRVLLVGVRKDVVGALRMPPKFAGRRPNLGDALLDPVAENGWTVAHNWALTAVSNPSWIATGKDTRNPRAVARCPSA
ncbi:DNA cytosine methyltransferase [Rhizobium leguminosarum]|nr:DNA cytosine methyltransferase [Rhizobium leguminosarum]